SGRPRRVGVALLVGWLTSAVGAPLMHCGEVAASGQSAASATTGPIPRAVRTPKPVALPTNLKIPRYAQGPEPFQDGEVLTFEASWEGIPAANARVVLTHKRRDPTQWKGEMWLNTSKVADVFYRMRDYFHEDFAYATWQPDRIDILQHEKSRLD